MSRPPAPTATAQPAPKRSVRPPKPASSAAKMAPTPSATDAPTKAPARVRRRARLEIPSAPTTTSTPIPTAAAAPTDAKSAGSPTKADQKEKAKFSPAGRPAKTPHPKARTTKTTRGLSALDAAAKVLESLKGGEAREGIQAKDLIERMQRTGLWTSPGGKTPDATLYAAMIREIKVKKRESRFTRVSPGHFAFKTPGKSSRRGAAE